MRTIYETTPQAVASLAAGAIVVVPVPFPSRVRLVRVNCIQTDGGAAEAFELTFYNRLVTNVPALADELYRCTETMTGASGSLVDFFDGVDRFFFPHDADPALGMKQRVIYARLNNTGSVAHTYSLILAAEDQS